MTRTQLINWLLNWYYWQSLLVFFSKILKPGYNPATLNLDSLKRSLNPITRYKIPGASKILPEAGSWNIV